MNTPQEDGILARAGEMADQILSEGGVLANQKSKARERGLTQSSQSRFVEALLNTNLMSGEQTNDYLIWSGNLRVASVDHEKVTVEFSVATFNKEVSNEDFLSHIKVPIISDVRVDDREWVPWHKGWGKKFEFVNQRVVGRDDDGNYIIQADLNRRDLTEPSYSLAQKIEFSLTVGTFPLTGFGNNLFVEFPEPAERTFGIGDSAMTTNEQKDRAMLKEGAKTGQTSPGGIDMNPNNFDLITDGDVINIDVKFNPRQIQNINIEGFIPVIINITPVTNVPMLLGLVNEEDEGSDYNGKDFLDPLDIPKPFKAREPRLLGYT